MPALEFIGVGDLHFEKSFKYFDRNQSINYIIQHLNTIANYAREHGVKHVIQLGDVFETAYPEDFTKSAFIRFLFKNTDLKWWFILGNHDWDQAESNSLEIPKLFTELSSMKGIEIFLTPQLVKLEGVYLYFMPFPYTNVPKTKKEKIVFAHREFKGAKRDTGMIAKEGDKPPTKDYWICGHLHTYQRLNDRTLFIGSPSQHSFGEKGKKGFCHFSISCEGKKLNVEHKFIKLKPNYKYSVEIINNKKDLKKLSSKPNHLYQLIKKDYIHLPESFRNDYPNIVDVKDFDNKSQLKQLRQQELAFEANISVGHDLKENLAIWLESQKYKNKIIKRSLALADKHILNG